MSMSLALPFIKAMIYFHVFISKVIQVFCATIILCATEAFDTGYNVHEVFCLIISHILC